MIVQGEDSCYASGNDRPHYPAPKQWITFFNYKGHNSIVLLAIADSKYRFIYVDIGAYGKESVSTIFHNTKLYDLLMRESVAALHHSWTSATSGLRGLFLITCRQNFFVCEAPSGARPSAVAKRRRRLAPPLIRVFDDKT
ncbi:hypothetical protein EVAR_74954_1 [Eumeta japonica]|uniref:DDE Tnp4 domain-containing protein n=1 Tax=Eumeta variegata TaxID=151549 RepID=A0A4C1UJN4_EUMVA|nr:hypothetical protein EVAR_74954_1 [Eumeta japonica]